uniref:hypothetical protein n=1 Tax=Tahibacter caeni TaxID=1453545 RepID=UPI0021479D8D
MVDSVTESEAPRRAAAGERALRQRLESFVAEWRANLGDHWDGAKAGLLHEELEKINAEAEARDFAEIAVPTLELIVFLCSFVETGAIPSAVQRAALGGLVDGLAPAAAAPKPAPRAVKRAPASSVRGQVNYLAAADRAIDALAP